MDMFTLNAAKKQAEKLLAGVTSGVVSHSVDEENNSLTLNFADGTSSTMTISTPQAKVDKAVNAYLEKDTTIAKKTDINYVNVRDYGAIGDGIADDTEAIQAVIDSIKNYQSAVIYFPKGCYRITKGLTIGKVNTMQSVHLLGACKVSKEISNMNYETNELNYMVSTLFFDTPADNTEEVTLLSVLGSTTNSYCTIKNMAFKGNSYSNPEYTSSVEGEETKAYEFTSKDYIQNGIIISATRKQSHCEVDCCGFSGFSGIALQTGLATVYNDNFFHGCNVAIAIGQDSILNNHYVTMSNIAFDLSGTNGTAHIYNFWTDIIGSYAIYGSSTISGDFNGHIDHIGANAIRCAKISNSSINITCNRTNGNMRAFNVSELIGTDLIKGAVIGTSYGIENSNIVVVCEKSAWNTPTNDDYTCLFYPIFAPYAFSKNNVSAIGDFDIQALPQILTGTAIVGNSTVIANGIPYIYIENNKTPIDVLAKITSI